MKILQRLVIDDSTLVFTDNPEQDIADIQNEYNKEDRACFLGYELPQLIDFDFLGNKYKAISFWHDNEDIREIELEDLIK